MNLKESRISFLLLFSLSLLLLAFIILFAWGFIYYRNAAQTAKNQQPNIVYKDSSNLNTQRLKDSLQKMYSNTVAQLNNQLDVASMSADSIKENIDGKYREFSIIRTEISELLENSKTVEQVNNAKQKLLVLQQRLEDWRKKYNDVAAENQRLSALLKQLSAGGNQLATNAIPAVQREVQNNITDQKVNTNLPAMQVASLQLQAIDEAENTRLSGSMNVINNVESNELVEMFVVILQPDGKPVKQSAWNTGSFETKEGTRIYSCKLRFDCAKGENKALSFSVPSAQFQKGKYSILVYHKGVMVAKGTKQLS